jgi:hypothetical protein
MTRIIALLAFVLTTSTAFAIDIKDEIILEWSSGLVYRWYCLGEKEGTLNAEDEKMMEGIDRTTAARRNENPMVKATQRFLRGNALRSDGGV